jgi:hypothetical protein
MTSAVMRNAAVTAPDEKKHLVLERVRAQRPAVAENDRLPGAPVIVVNLRSVLQFDRAHGYNYY